MFKNQFYYADINVIGELTCFEMDKVEFFKKIIGGAINSYEDYREHVGEYVLETK